MTAKRKIANLRGRIAEDEFIPQQRKQQQCYYENRICAAPLAFRILLKKSSGTDRLTGL
jgi:hypothetical protein